MSGLLKMKEGGEEEIGGGGGEIEDTCPGIRLLVMIQAEG